MDGNDRGHGLDPKDRWLEERFLRLFASNDGLSKQIDDLKDDLSQRIEANEKAIQRTQDSLEEAKDEITRLKEAHSKTTGILSVLGSAVALAVAAFGVFVSWLTGKH